MSTIKIKYSLLLLFTIANFAICYSQSNSPQKKTSPKIGDFFQGGIVFYVDSSGKHGFICTNVNQGAAVKFGDFERIIPGMPENYEAVGAGRQNTEALVKNNGKGNYAASICDQLVLNGYDDWFLPSKGEMELMENNLYRHFQINLSAWNYYWTSSVFYNEKSEQLTVWCMQFANEIILTGSQGLCHLRAIRSF